MEIARELVCWYYKINEHGLLLKEIRDELRADNAAKGIAPPSPSEHDPDPDDKFDPEEPEVWK